MCDHMHKTLCTMVVFVWKNILVQNSGMESAGLFNFVRGPLFQARVTFICNSQTGEFCISENVWSIFFGCLLCGKKICGIFSLPEPAWASVLTQLNCASTTWWKGEGWRRKEEGDGEGWRDDTGMRIWASHIHSPGRPIMSFVTWLRQQCPSVPMHTLAASGSVSIYCTGTQIIIHISQMCCIHTWWAVLWPISVEATSGHCLTLCISSTVSTGLPAPALVAQDWGFGSSDCTVWKFFLFLFAKSFSCISGEGEEIPIAQRGCFLLKFNIYGLFSMSQPGEPGLGEVSTGTERWLPWVSVVSGIQTTAFVYQAG